MPKYPIPHPVIHPLHRQINLEEWSKTLTLEDTMKRIIILIALFLILFSSISAQATTMYYSFIGVVSDDSVLSRAPLAEIGGLPLSQQPYVGDYVYHIIRVDYDPSIPFINNTGGMSQTFPVEYISGTLWGIGPTQNIGYNFLSPSASIFTVNLFGHPIFWADGPFALLNNVPFSDWTIGTQVIGYEGFGIFGDIYESLLLYSISEDYPTTLPTPEPGTMILLGSGFGLLWFVRTLQTARR